MTSILSEGVSVGSEAKAFGLSSAVDTASATGEIFFKTVESKHKDLSVNIGPQIIIFEIRQLEKRERMLWSTTDVFNRHLESIKPIGPFLRRY